MALTEIFRIRDYQQYNINRYNSLLFNTRLQNDDGHGGVGIYINETFTYTKREDLSIFIPHVFESICFEVQDNQNKPIIVGVVYRPNSAPRADVDMFISKIIEIQDKISNENKIAYLWAITTLILLNSVTHQKTNDFVYNVISQGFIPHITKPTRITSKSATLIDHLYSNNNHPNYESGIIVTDVAYHFGILLFHIIYGTPRPKKQYIGRYDS